MARRRRVRREPLGDRDVELLAVADRLAAEGDAARAGFVRGLVDAEPVDVVEALQVRSWLRQVAANPGEEGRAEADAYWTPMIRARGRRPVPPVSW